MIEIKHYPKDSSYGEVFRRVISFLNEQNERLEAIHFHWSRFEWMIARHSFKVDDLSQITLFERDQRIVGALIFEDEPGILFAIHTDDFAVKKSMVDYVIERDIKDDLVISRDDEMIDLLSERYRKLDWIDPVTRFELHDFRVPMVEGYTFSSLAEEAKLEEIHRALWLGFDHGDDITYSKQDLADRKRLISSPNFDRRYGYVAVKDGHYVSYASIWYMKGTSTALIEPVATTPKHRRKGLAKACIYRAILAVLNDGAKHVFVGSNRDVYIKMGFSSFDYALRFKRSDL
jgi:predicted N-acetyltransferase YhbS